MENLDFEALRYDLIDYFESAFIVGGFGVASIEALEVKNATNQKLIDLAKNCGFNLNNYIIEIDIKKK